MAGVGKLPVNADRLSVIKALVLLAVLLHLPFAFKTAFFADDFIQAFALQGDARLEQAGFANQGEPGTLAYAVRNQFYFFHPDAANYQVLRQHGVVPWWTPDDARIRFFRPLASFTHWLDYQMWPDSIRLMHAHSLLILLLAAGFAFLCYWRVAEHRLVAWLAVLILLLDISAIYPLEWVAGRNSLLVLLFAPLVLLCLQRGRKWLPLSWLFYACALLSAEAGVGVAGFVLAWVLFMHRGSMGHKAGLLLPYIVITFIWRWYYQVHGYGAAGIGQYIDPVAAPLDFLAHGLLHYPVLVIHTLTGIEASDFFVRGQWRLPYAITGVVLALLPPLAARYLCVATRQWWFWYSASLLSLLPMVSLTLSDPRISLLAHVAFAPALAMLLHAFCLQANRRWLSFADIFVIVAALLHIIAGLFAYTAVAVMPEKNIDAIDSRFNGFPSLDVANKHLLLANAVDPFRLMYYPYRAVWHNKPMAASVRSLMLAETAVTITRLDNKRYRLEQNGGMLLYPDDTERYDQGRHPGDVGGVAGMSYLLSGFFHDGEYHFSVGQRFDYDDTGIIVSRLINGRPAAIEVLVKADNTVWLYWDWQTRHYRVLPSLAVGQSTTLQGKYEHSQP